MKKPKKILVIVLASIAVVVGIGGFVVKSQMDKVKSEIMNQTQNEVREVEQGTLEVTVVGSGSIVPINKTNPDYSKLELEVEIDEMDIPKVSIDQRVAIDIDALPKDTLEGRVTEISQSGNVMNGVSTFIVKISIPNPIVEMGIVNEDTIDVRKGKSSSYMKITQLKKDDKVEVLEESDGYYKVKTKDDVIGYVSTSKIDIDGIKEEITAIVSSETVNVRSGAYTNYSAKVKIVEGDKVDITDKYGDWYKVRLEDDSDGWVYKDDVNIQNVKVGMSASASILTESKDNILYIPIEAVSKDENGNDVVVLASTKETKPIQVGINNENYIEVTSGLNKGDEIELPSTKQTLELDSMNPLTMPFKMLDRVNK